jgi:hypothetical protein
MNPTPEQKALMALQLRKSRMPPAEQAEIDMHASCLREKIKAFGHPVRLAMILVFAEREAEHSANHDL